MMHLGYSHLVSEINFNGRYVRAGQRNIVQYIAFNEIYIRMKTVRESARALARR